MSAGYTGIRRKIRVAGRMTTVQLESFAWDSFDAICGASNLSIHALVSRIDARRRPDLGLTSAIRLFVLAYWRLKGARPSMSEHLAVDHALNTIMPFPDGAGGTVIQWRERIAPSFTPRRMELARALGGQHGDPRAFGAAVRAAWGPRPPWQAEDDAPAGEALRTLIAPPPEVLH